MKTLLEKASIFNNYRVLSSIEQIARPNHSQKKLNLAGYDLMSTLLCDYFVGLCGPSMRAFDSERNRWPLLDKYDATLDSYLSSSQFELVASTSRLYIFKQLPPPPFNSMVYNSYLPIIMSADEGKFC